MSLDPNNPEDIATLVHSARHRLSAELFELLELIVSQRDQAFTDQGSPPEPTRPALDEPVVVVSKGRRK